MNCLWLRRHGSPDRLRLPGNENQRYIFENEWQSFRTRQNRGLELKSALHTYDTRGRYTVAAKVIDIFGNDTMTLVPVKVG
jgi:site-specific DNA-methyltransferase (adenine-specific)/adenine-specific DNA-methyltransferase